VQRSEEVVAKLVREMLFSRCELLLSEAGSCGTGIVREPKVRETSVIGSRYQAKNGEDSRLRRLIVSMCCSELRSV
jgi:hypothetical protein